MKIISDFVGVLLYVLTTDRSLDRVTVYRLNVSFIPWTGSSVPSVFTRFQVRGGGKIVRWDGDEEAEDKKAGKVDLWYSEYLRSVFKSLKSTNPLKSRTQ